MLGKNEARQFLIDCKLRGLADITVARYSTSLDLMLQWCWDHKLNPMELRPTEITACINRPTTLGRKAKPGTVGERLKVMQAFYRWLWENDYTAENLTAKVRPPKIPHPLPRPIPDEDWLKMWGVTDAERVRAALVLTFYLGLRGDEVRQLRTEQIGKTVIHNIVRKGGEKQTLPWRRMLIVTAVELPSVMPLDVSSVYESLLRVRKYEHVWPMESNHQWLRERYEAISVTALGQKVTPHRGRASATTNLLRAGMPAQYVKWLLNIRRWQTLEHYAQPKRAEFFEWFNRRYGDL